MAEVVEFNRKARRDELISQGLQFKYADRIAAMEEIRHREAQKTPDEILKRNIKLLKLLMETDKA